MTSVAARLGLERLSADVSFCVLGVVSAFDATGGLLPLGSSRRRAVLAALLLDAGRSISVDRLVDLLWDETAPATAATMVHTAVAGLRRTLETGRRAGAAPLIVTHQGGYSLNADPQQVDMVRFEHLLLQGRQLVDASPSLSTAVLTSALALWRGPAFGGIDRPFALGPAARLDELRIDCAESLMSAELGLGRHHDVVAELESLVARYPLRERLTAQLILAQYRCGRPSDALASYRRLRHALDVELGVAPGPELQALEVAVLRRSDELELTSRVATGPTLQGSTIPAPISSFVGRSDELAELSRSIGVHRLITLTGTGGTGKTRLALEVARNLLATGRAVVFLVDLTTVTNRELFDEALADALGIRAQTGRALATTIAAALTGQDVVIVLDNCEHLLEKCATFVQALLAASRQMRILATSREPLGVPGERVHRVPPLELVAREEEPDRIAGCEAVRLFTDRAAAARPDFTITPDDAQLILAVCRRLDALPLAIELAAARAASMPLADLANLLVDRFDVLDLAVRSADLRHRSLAATVAWSYDLLSAQERVLFAQIGVFPASFDRDAAAAIAAENDPHHGNVAMTLSRLVSCSLVGLEDGLGASTRYRLLETTRQFGRERWTDAERADLGERHARHYLALVRAAKPNLFRAGSPPVAGPASRRERQPAVRAGMGVPALG